MNEKIVALLNNQVNKELFSEYFYIDVANYYVDEGLDGFANWFNIQAQEERAHAFLFMQYMQNNDLKVTLEAIDKPEYVYENAMDPLKFTLQHEKYVTDLIHTIYGEAYAVKDFRTMQFLDWFIKEQGEEEKNATDLIRKMELFGNDSKGLYLLDQELAARVYTEPSLVL